MAVRSVNKQSNSRLVQSRSQGRLTPLQTKHFLPRVIQIRKQDLAPKRRDPFEIVLPLYFGWEIVIRKVFDWDKHVIKPFKTYRQYITTVAILIVIVSVGLFARNSGWVSAATYTWNQTSWSGGVTATTATHASDRTTWDKYSAADTNIAVGTSVALTESGTTVPDLDATDFNAGTVSGTQVLNTGNYAMVKLTSSNTTLETNYNSIAASAAPSAFAYDAGNDAIWIAHSQNGVSRIASDGTVTNFALGSVVRGVAYDPINDVVWVLAGSGTTLKKLNTDSGAELASYTLASSGSAYNIEYDSTNQVMWLADTVNDVFVKWPVNAGSGTTYAMGININEGYVRYDSSSDSIWLIKVDGSVNTNNVVKMKADGSTKSTYSTGTLSCYYLEYDPVTPAMWTTCASFANGGLVKIAISNGTPTVYSRGIPKGLSYDSANQSMWVADTFDSKIYKVSLSGSSSTSIDPSSGQSIVYYDNINKKIWTNTTAGLAAEIKVAGFGASGSFTSQVMDTGGNSSYGAVSWNAVLPTSTTMTLKVRTSINANMSGATDWASCTTISSGADISGNSCVADGQRYFQYQVSMTSSNNRYSPSFQDLSLTYNSYSNGTLTSSPFDTQDSTNILSGITWTTSGSGTVKFQLRTSADGNSWSEWLGPSGAGTYYTNPLGQTVESTHRDGSADRYLEYKVFLISSDGVSTPSLDDVTVTYVVNAAPQFQASPTAVQGSDGVVTIQYSVRDTDTSSGTAHPGSVVPSFEYSINNGVNWNPITTGLSSGATTSKAVDGSSYSDYSLTWRAKDQIDGTYASQAKIRVTVNDGEGANNTAQGTSSAFVLDVKDPVMGATPISVDASTSPATIHLSATDDSSLQSCLTLDNTQNNCQSYNANATLALATDPDTAYVIFKDAYGNTASANAVSPQTPTKVIIRDISNDQAGAYQLFVSWGSVSTPLDEFHYYRLYHSTDGSNFTLLSSIADRTINYYLHQSLTVGSTHYYKLVVETNSGNISHYSAVVSDTVNGQGGTDATAPTITNVTVGSINTQSAIITWDTDELSDSTVGYSATAGLFSSETGVATMKDSASGNGQHSVMLTGLQPGTTYYYRARSQDPADNQATDSNGGDGYTFTTLSGPAISHVTIPAVQNSQATVSWTTDQAADSAVYYSTHSDLTGATRVSTDESVTDHSVTITGLTLGTKYYFYVASGVAIDTNAGNYYYFVTTSDDTPPVITSVAADVVTDSSAIITWQTNEAASGKTYYGTSTGMYTWSNNLVSSLNISHSSKLTSLATSTTYYYLVVSKDSANNIATSSEYSFTTSDKLLPESEVKTRENTAREEGESSVVCAGGGGAIDILNPSVTDVDAKVNPSGLVTVSWKSSEPGTGLVEFGTSEKFGDLTGSIAVRSEHSIDLKDLQSNAKYYYRALTIDRAGNMGMSDTKTFNTGVVRATPKTDSSGTGDQDFLSFVRQSADYLKSMSAGISLSTLQVGLEDQQKAVQQLGELLPPPAISAGPTVTVGSDFATIQWTSDRETVGTVSYAASDYFATGNRYQQSAGADDYSMTHSVTLYNLEPETTYHFQVKNRARLGVLAQSRDQTFTTTQAAAKIDKYSTEIISPQSVTFKWVTTVATDSRVAITPYRNGQLAPDETLTKSDGSSTTIHQITVNDFETGVAYQIQLSGRDRSGSSISQIIPTFSTSGDNKAPEISQVKTESALSFGRVTKVQTIISWVTNEPSTSRVLYEKGVGSTMTSLASATPEDPSYTRNHVVVLTAFDPGSIYRFQVESTDSEGNVTRSKNFTILSPRQNASVFQVIVKNFEETFGWLGISGSSQ